MEKQHSHPEESRNDDVLSGTPAVPEDFEAQLRRLYSQQPVSGGEAVPPAPDAGADAPREPEIDDTGFASAEWGTAAPEDERGSASSRPHRGASGRPVNHPAGRPRGEPPRRAPRGKAPARKNHVGFLGILGRVLAIVLATVLLFAGFLMAVMLVVTHGPSQDAQRLFVLSANETSALKFLPGWFLSDEAEEAILHPAPVVKEPDTFRAIGFETEDGDAEETPGELVQITEEATTDELELIDIREGTFKGKMLIIHDPARVLVGTLDSYGGYGIYLTDFIEKFSAVAGTNAGGFYDPDGQGNGGIPDGLVMRDGEIAYGSAYNYYNNVIGFDANHILHVGDMSGQEAIDAGIMSAVSFTPGPVLIQDGEKRTGLGGGVNPRTCIGQRADGAVLLAVIEGRHPDSIGATYDDLADMMEEYGAVNAANLDGGSSSAMIYEGEQITKGSSLIGSRRMATAILILP